MLTNRKVSIQLRLKLFDTVVSPTILYGLATLPLSASLLEDLEIVQREMLRKIVGWVRIGDESWETTMSRMKDRVHRALLQRPVIPWTTRIGKALWKLIVRIKEAPSESWISQSSKWFPNECEDESTEFLAYRGRGRPSLKWDDVVTRFCQLHFNQSWQNVPLDVFRNSLDVFIAFSYD